MNQRGWGRERGKGRGTPPPAPSLTPRVAISTVCNRPHAIKSRTTATAIQILIRPQLFERWITVSTGQISTFWIGQLVSLIFTCICWIAIYALDSTIQRFKNQGQNYNKILKSDWLSTVLISAFIGQCNRTACIMPK